MIKVKQDIQLLTQQRDYLSPKLHVLPHEKGNFATHIILLFYMSEWNIFSYYAIVNQSRLTVSHSRRERGVRVNTSDT